MAEVPHPHPSEFNEREPGRPRHYPGSLSNLDGIHPHPPTPYYSHDWRPSTIDEFCTWNSSPQGIFHSTLVGPGQNSVPLPHPQPAHPSHTSRAPVDSANSRKRKQTAPSGSIDHEPPPVGGYGPTSRVSSSAGTDSPSSSPPPPSSKRCCNGADDVWAFSYPLASRNEPPADQWPTSLEPHITSKLKSKWFGCKLCLKSGYIMSTRLGDLRANSLEF